ncbi:hypothetical protein ODZ84_15600 [Chryseobacterium fluminis]|uniref:hypothetical protein n=1 Tax=Chryseobacterium fluminis TaxID=2983606 RepID=UPI0022511B6C|nr:hypothetical protein [Chryseobacterium sp. MMS21-Ot14]UZT96640.1 hypothetical protein ODZ84_15600 [Chryseobacterium sp. MMS21-Ot14]
MKKNYFFKAFVAVLLGLLVSCDNTTDDPINQNNTGNNGEPTITGPRVLNKVMSGTATSEEYITASGAISQVILKDMVTANSTTATVTYTGDKVSRIKYIDNQNPHVIDNEYNITYTGGRMTAVTLQQNLGSAVNLSDFTVSYDPAGTLYRIEEKKKMNGSATYTHYAEYKFTFSASNVVRMEHTAMLMKNNNPDPTTASKTNYAYDNYDNKINPYTTLSREYFIVTGILFPVNFNMISSNNAGKITVQNPAGAVVSYPKTYLYDSQNYPVSDQGQSTKYIYKAL